MGVVALCAAIGWTTPTNYLGTFSDKIILVTVNGNEVSIRSPKDAFDLQIGMIHQHFKLVDVLTVAENI